MKNHPQSTYPRILTIAGSDSGGGAGIQADLKTFSALGCYGMTAITAITAQNTLGVQGVLPIPAHMIALQIEAVVSDIGVDALKIGMLHNPEAVMAVAQAIKAHGLKHVVLDPVMVASSGDALMTEETVAALMSELMPLVSVITPNLDEAKRLLNLKQPITSADDFEQMARQLCALGARAVLIKGGHLPHALNRQLTDVLHCPETGLDTMSTHTYDSTRIDTVNTHGTGCTLSSAIACFLARGLPLPEAVRHAHTYTHLAIQAGAEVKIGHGHGPLNHGFAPQPMTPFAS